MDRHRPSTVSLGLNKVELRTIDLPYARRELNGDCTIALAEIKQALDDDLITLANAELELRVSLLFTRVDVHNDSVRAQFVSHKTPALIVTKIRENA